MPTNTNMEMVQNCNVISDKFGIVRLCGSGNCTEMCYE